MSKLPIMLVFILGFSAMQAEAIRFLADTSPICTPAVCEITNKDGIEIKNCYEESVNSYDALGLKPGLLGGIRAFGSEKPTLLESRSIPLLLNKKNVIIPGPSGKERFLAYMIPSLQMAEANDTPQIIILTPNLDIGYNISRSIRVFEDYVGMLSFFFMGPFVETDYQKFRIGLEVVIGSPPRVLDLMTRILDPQSVKMLVLEEASLLNSMYTDDLQKVVQIVSKATNNAVQICMTAEFLSFDVLGLAKNWMKDPVTLQQTKYELTLDGVKQYYIITGDEDLQMAALLQRVGTLGVPQYVVYADRKRIADTITAKLKENGVSVSVLHDNTSQEEKDLILAQFREGTTAVLVMSYSDEQVRSLEVKLIVNYNFPTTLATYLLRIGKSRCQSKGAAIHFVFPDQMRDIQDIAAYYNTQIVELPSDTSGLFN